MFNKTIRPESSGVEAVPEACDLSDESGESALETLAAEVGHVAGEGELSALQGKYDLLQDQFARLAADFDNYRKRTREEQESLVKYGAQKCVMELLPVLDNLDRATASLTETSDPKTLYKSFGMVQKQLMDGLEALGVKKIQAIGQPFDPQFHEAVNRMPSADVPENAVLHEAQSGYQLHEKVIRPAMVVVSTGAPDAPPTDNPFQA